jgi:hypothetical protein
VGQQASATAGCTATYKLRATLSRAEFQTISTDYEIEIKTLKLASLSLRVQDA